MTRVVFFYVAVGVALILGVVLLEWSDGKEKTRRSLEWPEFDALLAARDATGHVE